MKLLVFDTETTGLTLHPMADLATQPRIIEFAGAMIDSDAGKIVEEHSVLINPLMALSEEITRITGITDAMLIDAPTFPEAISGIAAFFKKADAMVAHNFQFDEAMLRNDLQRHGMKAFPWPRLGICTVQLYTEEWGRNPKLTELYERKMGRPLAQTHRALDDVRALCEIVIKDSLWEIYPS